MTGAFRYSVARRLLPLIAACAVLCGCGGDPAPSPTAPTPAPAPAPLFRLGTVDGTVRWVRPRSSGPIFDALVEVQSHTGQVFTARTDDHGYFRLEVPEGTAVVRAVHSGYVPVTRAMTVDAGHRVAVQFELQHASGPLPSTPGEEWVVEGTVTDTRGTPLRGLRVLVKHAGTDLFFASSGDTDVGGRYRIATRRTRPPSDNYLVVPATGHVTARVPLDCCALHTTVDFRIRRIAEMTLRGPESLVVTEAAPIVAVVRFDDGEVREINPGVLPFLRQFGTVLRNSPRGPGWVEGVSPGTANVFWSYYGLEARLTIRVVP